MLPIHLQYPIMMVKYRQVRRFRRIAILCAISMVLVYFYLKIVTPGQFSHPSTLIHVPVISAKGLEAYDNNWVGFSDLTHVHCADLFAKSTMNSLFPKYLPRVTAAQIATDSSDCPSFWMKYGFSRYTPVTEEEKEFPLAYIILFHKDLNQVLFLLRAIYRQHNVYCLSVDLDSGAAFVNAVKEAIRCLPNVFVAEKLESIVYGGFSRFKADLNCMEELLKHQVKWKYLHNLPGQQFPLRTNLEIVKILKNYNGTNDILGMTGKRSLHRRYKNKHRVIFDKNTGKNIIVEAVGRKSDPPHGFKIIKGSAYGSFSRAFVEFLMTDRKVGDLIEWSKDVESPDEYVFSTLQFTNVMDVPGGERNSIPEQNRFLASFSAWENETPCASMFVRWICIFSTADLPLLIKREELFANKFYIDHHPTALHCLDQFLYNMTVAGRTRKVDFSRK